MMVPFTPAASAALSASASSGRVAVSGDGQNIRVYNAGAALAYLKFGNSTVTAATTDMAVPAGAIEVFSVGGATHVAAITASNTATIYLTRGEGV